ncbi:MAG: 23S rRNA (adenine(2503)-C(2))-methyltransferase RlmN [Clostridia bacterium]|nr:23S rRNA (adenine(2503)-C(2))-methyltransferase RlmN [Clostridia bacterium]
MVGSCRGDLIDIRSLLPDEVAELIAQLGQPKYRAKQVFKWLHRGVDSFDEMSDLPKNLREELCKKCYISSAQVARRLVSSHDETKKYLFRLHDGEYVESVLMKYEHGYSICISTQVGCKMGCTFCATGRSGFSRNLTASEMLAQIMSAQKTENIRISNVVLMGMGEPLDNFDNVMRFLTLVSHEDGICIGMRHITLSTCGLVDKLEELLERKLQITLSVSLHAPNDEIRASMMPVNNRWGVAQLIDVCRRYAGETGRRVSFEYALVGGVNDTDDCARQLASLLRGMLCHVNLIPVNTVEGTGYFKPSSQRTQEFRALLEKHKIPATVRRTLGSDINASCGQLRRNAHQ